VNVYWTVLGSLGASYMDGAIYTCPITGCGASPTLVTTGQKVATELLIVGPDLYWTTMGTPPATVDGSVMRCTLASCDATKTVLASALKAPFRLAVDGKYVYFTSTYGANAVRRVPVGGGAVTSVYRGASGAYGLAQDTDYVYFTIYGIAAADGAVYRIAK
jgi:hypothetical protein